MNQKGQSLLEIVLFIGVVVIIATGLTITVVNGLKNSQFSKNQTQATKLAQEGLEKVRFIQQKGSPLSYVPGQLNGLVCAPTVSVVFWDDMWRPVNMGIRGNTSDVCVTSDCQYTLKYGGACTSGSSAYSSTLWLSPTNASNPVETIGIFKRSIYIEDVTGFFWQKKITSEVAWSDSSGNHKSTLTTIFTDPNH